MSEIEVVNAFWSGDSVVVASRDHDGRRRTKPYRAVYACYIDAAELVPDLKRILTRAEGISGYAVEGRWARIDFKTWADLKEWAESWDRRDGTKDRRSRFERLEIPTYEADVNPVRRFMIDAGTKLQRPRRVYLDIETDSRVSFKDAREGGARVLSWALVDPEGGWSVGCLDEDTNRSERELLQDLIEELEPFDQIAAWNGDGFDFPVIQARCDILGIATNLKRRWLLVDQLAVFRDMNVAAESGDEKQSMKLGAVATSVLGETKDDLDSSRTWDYWAAGGEDRARLVDYNRRDADLLRLIEDKTGFLELLFTVCEVCHVLPDSHGRNGTVFVEGFLLSMAHARGERFPTHWVKASSNKFEGAYVMAPDRGILRDVHVADFAALYPSIIQSWNMSPETLAGWRRPTTLAPIDDLRDRPDGLCEVPGASAFKTDPPGMLADAVTELRRLRKQWNDQKSKLAPGTPEWKDADRRSTAYKVAANTFYGVIGSPFSRFFVRAVAESVTAAGRWLITETIKAAEHRGWRVVYCDTDSIFVAGVTEDAFRSFVKWCNEELYPVALRRLGCIRNEISLAYEKEFAILVFVTKKRYAGKFTHYKGTRATADSKPEIKGLEFKRGDSIRMARELQSKVIDDLMAERLDLPRYHALISEYRDRCVDRAHPLELRDFVQSKTVKDLGEYKIRTKKSDGSPMAQPTHVEVAKVMAGRGRDVSGGTRVEFIVVDGACSPMKAIPAEDYTPGAEDRYYLWESLVYPPTQRLLEAAFPGEDWRQYEKVRPAKPRATPRRRKSDANPSD